MTNSSRPPRRPVARTHSPLSTKVYPCFLGTGWSFPPTFVRQGSTVSMAVGDVDIKESLWIIVATRIGERIMLATFGSNLSQCLFATLTTTVANEIASMVLNAIIEWEPRVTVTNVSVTQDDFEDGYLSISIDYIVRQTNSRSNLVIPYYLLEATLSAHV